MKKAFCSYTIFENVQTDGSSTTQQLKPRQNLTMPPPNAVQDSSTFRITNSLPLRRIHPIQKRHSLHMPRLRKEIEPPQTLNLIPQLRIPRHQHPHIPRLAMHITTDIDHALRPEPKKLLQKVRGATLPRRIDDDDRLRGREGHASKQGRGIRLDEADIGEIVGGGVGAGGGDGGGVDVDAEGGFEEGGEGDGEEAGAAVGVQEVFDRRFAEGGGRGRACPRT